MKVVDFHAHFFSRPFFESLAAQSPLPGTVEEKLSDLARVTGLELPPEDVAAHTRRWLEELDGHEVDHMVAFASLPAEAPAVEEAVRASSGRLTGMTLVDPHQGDEVGRVRELMEGGAYRGVLTFPAMHYFDTSGYELEPVLSVLSEFGGVCYVHCGLLVVKLRDLLGLPRRYDLRYANPLGLVRAANAFPDVAFVIPHFGAGFLREALMACAQCENVHLDTSSSNSWIRTQPGLAGLSEVFARALDVAGPRRILFGTDSTVFPAGWRADRLEEQRRILEDLGVDEEAQRLIFCGNAERLLHLA